MVAGSGDGRGGAPAGAPAGSEKYVAFISYSHAADGVFATRLQSGIERFATPRRRGRTVRVFRDDANLAASPDLWGGIVVALADARWLVLLASPAAAQSEWVGHEIAWWRTHRSPERIILVHTIGSLVWSNRLADFDRAASSALHPALVGAFRGREPRVVDARAAAATARRDNAAFESVVADVTATVRGVDKDLISGEHLAVQRTAVRRARLAATAVSVLAVLALVGGLVALDQRNEAVTQATVATARAYAAGSGDVADQDPALSAHLALAAHRLDPSAAAMGALKEAHDRIGPVVRVLEYEPDQGPAVDRRGATGQARAVDTSADGRRVAVYGREGTLRVWDRDTGALLAVGEQDGVAPDISDDGRFLLTAGRIEAVDGGRPVYVAPPGATIDAMSADARLVGLVGADGTRSVVDLASPDRRPRPATVPREGLRETFPELRGPGERRYDQLLVDPSNQPVRAFTDVAPAVGRWARIADGAALEVRDLRTDGVVHRATLPAGSGDGYAVGIAGDGSAVVVGDDRGAVTAYDGELRVPRPVATLPGQINEIVVAADGASATVLDYRGNVVVVRLRGGDPLVPLPDSGPRAGGPGPVSLTPSPDGRLLLVARDRQPVELWSLAEQRRLAQVPVVADRGTPGPVLAFDAAGTRVAVRTAEGVLAYAVDGARELTARPIPVDPAAPVEAFRAALGADAPVRRDGEGVDTGPTVSPSGRTEVESVTDELTTGIAPTLVTDREDGSSVPLAGGLGPGAFSAFAFADGDAVVVENRLPDRGSADFRPRLQLWHRDSGARIGEWAAEAWPTLPDSDDRTIVVVGDRTAVTARPDGGLAQWIVAPSAWARRLCELYGEPTDRVRREQLGQLGDRRLCGPDPGSGPPPPCPAPTVLDARYRTAADEAVVGVQRVVCSGEWSAASTVVQVGGPGGGLAVRAPVYRFDDGAWQHLPPDEACGGSPPREIRRFACGDG